MSDTGQKLTSTNQGRIQIEDIDGRIIFRSPDGRYMIIGLYSGLGATVKFGIGMYDASDNLVSEVDFTTWKWHDISDGTNVMQVGKLPDSTYGQAIAKSGYNISDGIT